VDVTLGQLATLVGGTVVGDPDASGLVLQGASPLSEARPGHITFVEDEKRVHELVNCQASAVIARGNHLPKPMPLIVVPDPLAAFLRVFQHLHGRPELPPHGIDARADIHPSVKLGNDVSIHPFVSVGEGSIIGDRCRLHAGVAIARDCQLGNDCVLYPHAVLYDGCILGDRVVVHANAVLGADGFGFRTQQGRHVKIPQMGRVVLENDVEIGACTTIDRGTFQATRVREGTKIDNLVQIGHNCTIGKHNILVGQVGIAGSCTTGEYVVMAGQVGVADHLHIGDRVVIGARAGVVRDIPAGQRSLGVPAMPERDYKTIVLTMLKLPTIHRDVQRLKKHVALPEES
jgi:UDP-3-O-[3-hydroxymyristoyl] glucosamine N-acyltransferase